MSQAEQFFSELYRGQTGVLELRTFDHPQANRLRSFIQVKDGQLDYTHVQRFLQETEALQLGAFFGVALRTAASLKTRKGDAAHCQTLTTLFVDADFKHLGEEKTREGITAFPAPPSMLVHSGGGLHPYWLLDFPIFLQGTGGMAKAKSYLKRIAKSVADVVDESVSEPVRVLRIPGSFNFKKHYDKPRPVTLETCPAFRYKTEEIESILQSVGAPAEAEVTQQQSEGFKVPETIRSGDRHEMLYKLLRSQKARGISLEAALAACHAENKAKCNPPIERNELDRYLTRVWEQPDSPTFVHHAKKTKSDAPENPEITGEREFVRAKKGDAIDPNNRDNILMAFDAMNVSLRFDIFSQKPFITYGDYDGVLMDEVRNRIWLEMDRMFGFRPSPDFFDVVLHDQAARNKVHPVREYVQSLKWDGVPRIANWLVNATGAGNSEYVQAISKIVLVAAVRRVMKPGCKFDEMLVLESDVQGLQKSTALRALAVNDPWFSDDLPLNVDAKQVIERTGGKWIIEAQELSGIHKSQAEHLKSMLSRQVDGPVRMAYARLPVEQPRQFIIIGTTNSREYLSDSTGNRRFWPVQIEKCNVDFILKWRDQWWAEAVVYEKQGMSIRLDPRLYGHAELEQEDRRTADPWEMRIRAAWDQDYHRITPQEIWTLLNVPVERQDHRHQVRISQIMQRCGFRRMTVRDESLQGKPVKGWGKGDTVISSMGEFDNV